MRCFVMRSPNIVCPRRKAVNRIPDIRLRRPACFVRQLFDLAQIVGRPTDRTLFYRLSRYARTPLPTALVGFDLDQHTSLCHPFTSAR